MYFLTRLQNNYMSEIDEQTTLNLYFHSVESAEFVL